MLFNKLQSEAAYVHKIVSDSPVINVRVIRIHACECNVNAYTNYLSIVRSVRTIAYHTLFCRIIFPECGQLVHTLGKHNILWGKNMHYIYI